MTWFRSLRRKSQGRGYRVPAPPSDSRVTRDIIGPTGWLSSNAWQQLDDNGEAYKQSFDRRLPPSLFVSERDRLRANQPMPLSERCIEDYHDRRAEQPPQ